MLKRIALAVLLFVIWYAASRSLLAPQLFRVHDYVHGTRIGEMTRALEDGHFPVRWSENFGFGYGMPLFEFYAPLPFYIGSAYYWLTSDLLNAIRLLFIMCNTGTLFGAYFLGKKMFGRSAGLVTAAVFTLAPYRAVNLYVRGALSEAWGMMAMPWILLGGIKIIRREKYGWPMMVLGLVTLMLSHNLTTLIFVPVSAVFLGAYWLFVNAKKWLKKDALKSATTLLGSYLLAGGLSAFYMIPAFAEKDLTKINTIVGGYFDYRLHFLYIRQLVTPYWGFGGSTWGPEDGLSFFLGWIGLLGMGLTGGLFLWWLIKRYKKVKTNIVASHTFFFFVVCTGLLGLSIFMTLEKSLVVWNSASFFTYVQFPWRWLGVATLFIGLLVGMAPALIQSLKWRYITALLVTLGMVLTTWTYFVPEIILDRADGLYYTDPAKIQTVMSEVLQDYIPIQMEDSIAKNPQPQTELIIAGPSAEDAEVLVDRVHEKLIRVTVMQPTVMDLRVADFAGWEVELDGEPVTKESTKLGTIAVNLPGDNQSHLVGVRFGSTPVRLIADVISLISIMLLAFAAIDIQGLKESILQRKARV